MRGLNLNALRALGFALVVLLVWPGVAHSQAPPSGTWQPLKNAPPFAPGTALLLTDGTIMVEDYGTGGGSPNWWKLTPDNTGSYVNGTWTKLASMQPIYGPLYFASAVLDDGRVVVIGGEYNFGNPVWTNMGAIYTPKTNKWKTLLPPPMWGSVGDAQSAVLNIKAANFPFFVADALSTRTAELNPLTLKWTVVGTGKVDGNDEEGWNLLPSGKVLTVDAGAAPNSELFNPATNMWTSAGSTIVPLADPGTFEIGPAVLRPDGTVFATTGGPSFGGTNAIYNTGSGTWSVGPSFPNIPGECQYDISDGPAALLPNGNVLCVASPGTFSAPSRVFEWDGISLTQVPRPPGAPGDPSFATRLLLLPTGQVLFDDGSSDVEIYTPSGTFNNAWRPTITTHPSSVIHGKTYSISGTQFNGLSQANAYGDDAQSATNYPLVRITNDQTQHVFYCRTHGHTSMGVATGALKVTTHFDVPIGIELGPSTLTVVANGIPATSVAVNVN
jgi:hypothetical protein